VLPDMVTFDELVMNIWWRHSPSIYDALSAVSRAPGSPRMVTFDTFSRRNMLSAVLREGAATSTTSFCMSISVLLDTERFKTLIGIGYAASNTMRGLPLFKSSSAAF
jgi:hypothetical protein